MAVEDSQPRDGESAQARPAQTAGKPERVRLRTQSAAAKTVTPNAAACR